MWLRTPCARLALNFGTPRRPVFGFQPHLWYNANIVEQRYGNMPKSITLAARVDADLDAELSRLAMATGRSKSWLITDALRSYVANERQFLAAVEEGKQALRDGRVVDHNTVVAAFERLVAPGA
jgi:RHH-type rel operon transcriptional repressor/antitoxin RelB